MWVNTYSRTAAICLSFQTTPRSPWVVFVNTRELAVPSYRQGSDGANRYLPKYRSVKRSNVLLVGIVPQQKSLSLNVNSAAFNASGTLLSQPSSSTLQSPTIWSFSSDLCLLAESTEKAETQSTLYRSWAWRYRPIAQLL